MRRPVLFALIAALVLVAIIAAVLFVQYRKAATNYSNMRIAEETARVGYAEAFSAVSEIQDSLNAITAGDSTVQMVASGLRSEMKVTEAIRRQALDRVSVLNASLQRNKAKIRQLEKRLRNSGVKVAGLEKMILGLKETVAEKEVYIANLSAQVDSLRTQVTGLQTEVQRGQETIQARDQVIEEKRREAATIYYIVAGKRELTTQGVIVSKGGVLGLGKTLSVSGRYNESLFTALDTDHESVVPTSAAKVQVISAQAPSSYELKLVGNRMELHILDAGEFRKVKHLVIMTR